MKFSELNEILQLRIKKSCRLNKYLDGWLPSSDDYVYIKDGKIEVLYSDKLEIIFENNNIISVNKF